MSEETGNTKLTTSQRNHRLLAKLGGVVVGMFVFAVFIMPPIYDAFCELTGLNGKGSSRPADAAAAAVDQSRELSMEFLVSTDKGLPWDFTYETPVVKVHPGQITKTMFFVKNRDTRAVTGRAVPSISPGEAARYVKKTECFCFREQRLEAGAEKAMPMIFYIDPAIPSHITTVTLSYKFYNLTDQAQTASR
ncbi:MAG: cytochrome c oxidase assembly protein [Moraxellaceae bacterium]|jgi:cytochrome c oxidase assembly protein subunit 11|nr:cytochrome c oxidase assembly protein [Moraxellaceae bacterium]